LRFIVTNRPTVCNNFATQLEKKNVFRKLVPTTRKNRKKQRQTPFRRRASNLAAGPPRLADDFPKTKRDGKTLSKRKSPRARFARKKKRDDEPVKARRRVSFNFFSNAAAFAVRKLDAFFPA
jgi:hypothetical protein